jgi:cell division protein FtsI (penicillin-binding protein 3)
MMLAIAFVLTLFGGRLIQLQGMESGAYRTAASEQRLHSQVLPGERGAIYGADGQPLALTLTTFTVTSDPTQVPAGQRAKYAAELARPLGLTQAQVLTKMQHPSSPRWTVLNSGITPSNSQAIAKLDVPGINQQPIYQRSYPDNSPTANLVGFTNTSSADVIAGQAGLEQQYNTLLSGHNGSEEEYTGADGQVIPLEGSTVKPATSGSSIKLTIIPALQYEAQSACQAQVKAMHAKNCTVVIMQPGTGNILAMAQWPTYYQPDLTNAAQATDLPVTAQFEPGSTAKIITAAAALEHGGISAQTDYPIPESIVKGGLAIHDAEPPPASGNYTLAGIIANSSNVGMAQVADTISAQTQYQYLKAFGLGQPTGVSLPGETAGTLRPLVQYWPSLRYTLAYGQGVDATALQMASVYATVANGGVRVQPRLVAGTTSPAGKYKPAPASPSARVIQPSTAKALIQIMQQVPAVDQEAQQPWGIIPGYAIAAKTGTSNEHGPECPLSNWLCEYGASYIGMAPGDNPQVVVAVNVQDPDKRFGHFGDVVAGPVFYQVMKSALQTLGIPPDGATVPNVRLTAP